MLYRTDLQSVFRTAMRTWMASVIGIALFISGVSLAFGQPGNSIQPQPKPSQDFDVWSLLDGSIGAGIAAGIAIAYAHISDNRKEDRMTKGIRIVVTKDLDFVKVSLKGLIKDRNYTYPKIIIANEDLDSLMQIFDTIERFNTTPLDVRARTFEAEALENIHKVYGEIRRYKASREEIARSYPSSSGVPNYELQLGEIENWIKRIDIILRQLAENNPH